MIDKIVLKDLWKISQNFSIENEDYFIDYLNSFSGNNVLQKFKNIIKLWERDVSYDINIRINDKDLKIPIFTLIDKLNVIIDNDNIRVDSFDMDLIFDINISSKFDKLNENLDIYNIVKSITLHGHTINFDDKTKEEKKLILDTLPAKCFNLLFDKIKKSHNKTFVFENPSLKGTSINFLTGDPYYLLRSMFSPYNQDYYRDIVYALSKKIDGDILMNSTLMDIEYYIDKLNDENKQNPVPDLY